MFWGEVNHFNMKTKNFMLRTKMLKIFPKLIIFVLLISFDNLKAQTDEQIINEILFDLFDPCQERFTDTIFIAEAKGKTFLIHDSYSYEYINGFAIPSNNISEWKENITNQVLSKWDEERLNKRDTTFVEKDTIIGKKPIFKCLSEHEISQILDRNEELINSNRQQFHVDSKPIYSIGNIIFDNSKETAIFRVEISSRPDVAWGYAVLIKKVFGKWTILTSFDYWMT
jgi:hypothetical protein